MTETVLFYDGDCGLCAKSVAWCLRHDRRGALRFSPLQGETYARLAAGNGATNIGAPSPPTDLSTVVFHDAQGMALRSEAMLRAVRTLGGPWAFGARAALVIPRPIRDAAYRFIAKRRIGWFGAPDACDLPTEAQRARFLP